MEKAERKKLTWTGGMVIACVLVIVILAAVYGNFLTVTGKRIAAAEQQSLTGLAAQQLAYAEKTVSRRFDSLTAFATLLDGENSKADFLRAADAAEKSGNFDEIILTDLSGKGIDSAANEVDISAYSCFSAALEGKTGLEICADAGAERAIFVCPIKDDSGVVGVLCGRLGAASLKEDLLGFSDSLTGLIADRDGNIVIMANDKGFSRDGESILASGLFDVFDSGDIETIRDGIKNGGQVWVKTGTGAGQYVLQTPLSCNGWSYFSAISAEPVSGNMLYLRRQSNHINAISVLAFLLCFGAMLLAMYRSRKALADENARVKEEKLKLELSEERYRLLAQDSEDIVFEANLTLHTIEANANFEKTFGEQPRYDWLLSGHRLHPDDRADYQNIVSKIHNRENDSREMRLMNKNGDYVWYMSTMSVVGGDSGVLRVVGKLTNIDARKRETELLELKAQTDAVTGLYNKAATGELIARALASAPGSDGTLMIIDIDNLKTINDTLGHTQGDRAISKFAATLKAHFRATDIIGRIGGDEFMVFADGVKSDAWLRNTAASLVRKLAALRVGENDEYCVHGSIGAAVSGDKAGFDELYKRADTALYQVKRNGKNGYAVYTSDMDSFSYEFRAAGLPSLRRPAGLDPADLSRLLTAVSELYPLIVSVNLSRNSYNMMENDGAVSSAGDAGQYDALIAEGAAAMHPDDAAGFAAAFSRDNLTKEFFAGRKMVSFDGRHRDSDGVYRLIRTIAVFGADDSARDLCHISFSRPIDGEY